MLLHRRVMGDHPVCLDFPIMTEDEQNARGNPTFRRQNLWPRLFSRQDESDESQANLPCSRRMRARRRLLARENERTSRRANVSG